MDQIDPSKLVGRWVHSHEESEGDRLVFRPPSYSFPPSRGRMSFNLLPDGKCESGGPGPDDRSTLSPGRWELHGNVMSIDAPFLSGTYEVEGVDEQSLVLRRR